MSLHVPAALLAQVWSHAEASYPEEGAGLLIGETRGDERWVRALLPLPNSFRQESRHQRYQIDAADMWAGEQQAEALGLGLVGVFHSHPDHPPLASDFDEERALPWFSYLITSVQGGEALESRSWRMADDRSHMSEEAVVVT